MINEKFSTVLDMNFDPWVLVSHSHRRKVLFAHFNHFLGGEETGVNPETNLPLHPC